MAPTLRDQDVVLLRNRGRPHAGAVVLVRWVERPGQLSIKRAVHAQAGGWHVEGDNARASTDSRHLGPAEVLAVVQWRLWPRPGRVR